MVQIGRNTLYILQSTYYTSKWTDGINQQKLELGAVWGVVKKLACLQGTTILDALWLSLSDYRSLRDSQCRLLLLNKQKNSVFPSSWLILLHGDKFWIFVFVDISVFAFIGKCVAYALQEKKRLPVFEIKLWNLGTFLLPLYFMIFFCIMHRPRDPKGRGGRCISIFLEVLILNILLLLPLELLPLLVVSLMSLILLNTVYYS